jgi:hypothetical protein
MIVRGSALALIAAVFCLALGAPAHAGCVGLSGTADGFDKKPLSAALNSHLPITSSNTRRRNISAPSR